MTDAFRTYADNLVDGSRHGFEWPQWLEKRAWDVKSLLAEHESELATLRGKVDLVCGGPPCQGFSFLGKRERDDVRNQLIYPYVNFVRLLAPNFVLLENVRGFDVPHGKKARAARQGRDKGRRRRSYSEILFSLLEDDYHLDAVLVQATDFGVPQKRERYFLAGIKKGTAYAEGLEECWASFELASVRGPFLAERRLPDVPVTTRQALADLEAGADLSRTEPYIRDEDLREPSGFSQIAWRPPRGRPTAYQSLMRRGLNGQAPTSLRLARHSAATTARFKTILEQCERGKRLDEAVRAGFGLAKVRVVPLDPNLPAHTITTLPDDLIHYSEPRILTVRESARLQSFPDWYDFRGKYTTGGAERRRECPRYTQVGNAVPPLIAEAWGIALRRRLHRPKRR